MCRSAASDFCRDATFVVTAVDFVALLFIKNKLFYDIVASHFHIRAKNLRRWSLKF